MPHNCATCERSIRHDTGSSGAIKGLHTVPHLARPAEPLASWLSWYKVSKNLVGDLQHFWQTKQSKLFSNCRIDLFYSLARASQRVKSRSAHL